MKLKIDRTGWAAPLIGIVGSAIGIAGAVTFIYGNRSVTSLPDTVLFTSNSRISA